MSLEDHSSNPKNSGAEVNRQADTCPMVARCIWNWFRRLETMDFLTGILALIAALQFWGYIKSERALVYADNVTLPRGLGNIDPLVMQLEIKNGGKSIATIKEVAAAISHQLPALPPPYQQASRFAFPPAVPGGAVKRPLTFNVSGGYKGETERRLRSGTEKLYLFGVIRYSDWANFPVIFGFKETGFCFVYVPQGSSDGFNTCDNPAYSYAN
jgi:hypothetical protein